MAAAPVHASVRERIERLGRTSGGDSRALRLAVLTEIRRVVDVDAYAWLLSDPETTVGVSPLADVPDLSELPRLVRARYLTTVNRWTRLDRVAVTRLARPFGGPIAAEDEWSRLLTSHGVAEVVTMVFADRYGCWGWLDLWRSASRQPLNKVHMAFLRSVADPVTTALRRTVAATFATPTAAGGWPAGPVVLLLSPELDVRRTTPSTEAYLRLLVPPTDDRPAVPAGAYNVAAQLLAVEAGVDHHPPEARVHLAGGRWVTMRAARLGGPGPVRRRDVAVTVEECSSSERLALFARCSGLTRRESELLGRLAAGADTRDLAEQMVLSPATVQDHLKSVFDKTCVRSRRALLARALGS